MSGITIGELANQPEIEESFPEIPADQTEARSGINILEMLKKPTGDGPVESYIEHPFNFDKSTAMAKIIRGFTGLLGNLNYWVVDVAMGLLEYARSFKNKPVGTPNE